MPEEPLHLPRLRIYGYLLESLLKTADAFDVPMHFAEFAEQRGYDLSCIYLERPATMPAAINALLDELDGLPSGTAVVAVPTFSHLALPGWDHRHLAEQLREATGLPVILAGYASSAAMT
ncbi:hypothetical protein E1263_20070 [Kribbella antibiotica]|uniref:Uncharacterized protein n=1 Tax=Kribbella antibiotica TaxID=190195 RepID=A0A4R4ZJJ3_9ACTN|nr:hypothetical protein [Kribbella antibiotica]TDD58216.1 hypothetical protein E1263_20070 [Kribbella antibiotica]